EEEINRAVKLQFLQRRAGAVRIRDGNQRIETDANEPFDLAALDGVENLTRGKALFRQVALRQTPELGDELSMLRIVDVAAARKLVAALAVFAPALTVALAGEGPVT